MIPYGVVDTTLQTTQAVANAQDAAQAASAPSGASNTAGNAVSGAGGAAMLVNPVAGAALMIGGQILNMFEAAKARKEAKKQQKKAEQQAAFNNLLRIVGGGMPADNQPNMPIPQSAVGQGVSGLGQALYALNATSAANQNAAFDRDLKERQYKLDAAAALTDKAYKEGMVSSRGQLTPAQAISALIDNAKAGKADKMDKLGAIIAGSQPGADKMAIDAAMKGGSSALPAEAIQRIYEALGIEAPAAAAPAAAVPGSLGGTTINWSH